MSQTDTDSAGAGRGGTGHEDEEAGRLIEHKRQTTETETLPVNCATKRTS